MNFRNSNYILSTSVCLIFASSFGVSLSVSAQREPNCARPDNQIEINTCIRIDYERADRELNSVWRQVISQLSGDEKERLIDRQLAWIDERDATCDRETVDNRRGNGYRTFLNYCLARVTRERTEVLRGYLR